MTQPQDPQDFNATLRRWLIPSALVFVVVLAVVIGLGFTGTGNQTSNQATNNQDTSQQSSTGGTEALTECPPVQLGEVTLDCLRAGNAANAAKAASTANAANAAHATYPENPAAPLTLVNVYAWWCQPCRKELPIIAEYAASDGAVPVLAVHEDSKSAAGRDIIAELAPGLNAYADPDGRLAAAWQLPGVIPQTLLMGTDGTVVARHLGEFADVAEVADFVAGAQGS